MKLEEGIYIVYELSIDDEDKKRFAAQFQSLPLSISMDGIKIDSSILMVALKNYNKHNPCDWFVYERSGRPLKYTGIEKLTEEKGYSVETASSSTNPVLRIKALDGDYFNIPMLCNRD